MVWNGTTQKVVVLVTTVMLVGVTAFPVQAEEPPQVALQTWEFSGAAIPWSWSSDHPQVRTVPDSGYLSGRVVCSSGDCDVWSFTFIGAHGDATCSRTTAGGTEYSGSLNLRWGGQFLSAVCDGGSFTVSPLTEPPIGPSCEADASAFGSNGWSISGGGGGAGVCAAIAV